MSERLPNAEFSETERALIVKLTETFPDDPEAHAMILAWSADEEARVKVESSAESGEDAHARANIELDLKKAKLYRAAGYYNQVWETLNAARLSAHNLGADDLVAQADAMMDDLDAETPEQD